MKKTLLLLCIILTVAFVGSAFANSMQDLEKEKRLKAEGLWIEVEEAKSTDVEQRITEPVSLTATGESKYPNIRGKNPTAPQLAPSDILDFAGSETFDANLGEFTTFTVSGTGWVWQTTGNPAGSAFYDDYSGAQDAYLVSIGYYTVPDLANIHFNFDQYENFNTYYVYHGVYVTTNYTGDPTTTTWDTLYQGVGNEDAWQTVHCALEAYRDSAVVFAFQYTGDYADEWSIDNIDVSVYVPPIAPDNDLCANADSLGGAFPITGSGTTIGATADCPGVLDWNGVWYTFEVPYAANDIMIEMCGVSMDVYNVGIVLMDDCLCDDYVLSPTYTFDSCGGYVGAQVYYDVYPGPATIYWPCLVEGPGYVQMDFTFTITCTEHVIYPGDNCDDPLVINIAALPYVDSNQTTCGRGNNYQDDLGDTTCLSPYYDGGEDIIYEITVDIDTFYNITLDPLTTTYTGFALGYDCPPTSCVFFNTNSASGARTQEGVWMQTGTTYYMMIDTWASPDCIPEFDLTFDYGLAPPDPPPNDSCQYATACGEGVIDTVNTEFATSDGSGPYSIYKNVWYCYTPSGTGMAHVMLCDSDYDTKLAAYETCVCDPLGDSLGYNDDGCDARALQSDIEFEVQAGTSYLIEAGSYSSSGFGTLILEITLDEYLDNDIAAVSIDAPPGIVQTGTGYTPMATFFNNGNLAQTFGVIFEAWYLGSLGYADTMVVTALDPDSSAQVSFGTLTFPVSGAYDLVAKCQPDGNNANNEVTGASNAYATMYIEDFEATNGLFQSNNDWQWGAPTYGPAAAHSGSNVWGTVLDTTYTLSTLSELTTPYFSLGTTNPLLAFYHWYDIEGRYDGGNVKISNDGGNNWTTISPAGGYDDTSNTACPLYPDSLFTDHNQGFWEMVTFDLAAYAGDNVVFKFNFGADGSVVYPGWYIDDFMMGDATVQDTCLVCSVVNQTPRVPRDNGTIQWDMTIMNCGFVQLPAVVGEIIPTNTDCNGTQYDFNLTRTVATWLDPGATSTSYYYYHTGPVDPFFVDVAVNIGVGPAVNNYYGSCCFEFTFTTSWARGGNPNYWGDKGVWGERDGALLPTVTALGQNFPNPFNATTGIPFDLAQSGNVSLKVYNLSGQLVETLVDGQMSAGSHIINWDASTVSSGIYFYKLTAGNYVTSKKMNLLK
ncbi:MAG: T9SS type A sorting domain-containing protein [candidate division Zixibacteria bacterium]|nr:T9SS type A sorting domain-containing protein [candidate division Zixibacteria bacterium]